MPTPSAAIPQSWAEWKRGVDRRLRELATVSSTRQGVAAVRSVNGDTGPDVLLDAVDVGALPASTTLDQVPTAVAPVDFGGQEATGAADPTLPLSLTTRQWVEAAITGGGGGAVTSVNGQTGVVVLDAADVGATDAAYVDLGDRNGKIPPWAASTVYKAGQVVTNGGKIWRALANFTSGASFSAINWTALTTTPTTHASTHATGGADPITPASIGAAVAGAAPAAHAASHGSAGSDPVTVDYATQVSGKPSTFVPSAHASSHGSGGSDPVTVAESQVTGLTADLAARVLATRLVSAGTGLTGGGDLTADRTLAVDFGTGAGKVTQGNDARLSDARTPTAHATSHGALGSDPITPGAIGAAAAVHHTNHEVGGSDALTHAAWTSATYTNSWTTNGDAAQYRRELGENVRLRGRITGGATGTVAFTLPAAYRPAVRSDFALPTNVAGSFGAAQVATSGAVTITIPAGATWVSLSPCVFGTT